MNIKDCYAALEGNYDEAMGRLRMDKLIIKFSLKFLDDKSFEELGTSLDTGNIEEAFRAAHTLKGVCQNLAFTKLAGSSSACCEALRAGDLERGRELFAQVKQDYSQTTEALGQLEA